MERFDLVFRPTLVDDRDFLTEEQSIVSCALLGAASKDDSHHGAACRKMPTRANYNGAQQRVGVHQVVQDLAGLVQFGPWKVLQICKG